MEKIVLFAFVVLGAILMVNAQNTTTAPPTTQPLGNNTMPPTPKGNDTMGTTTKAAGQVTVTPTAAVAVIQPLAIFVLACAFLGLLH